MQLYEIALGIEHIRIQKALQGKLTPWYWSFVALMLGIWRAGYLQAALFHNTPHGLVMTNTTPWLIASTLLSILTACLIMIAPKTRTRYRQSITLWLLAWFIFGLAIGAPLPQDLAPTNQTCTIQATAASGRLPGENAVIVQVDTWTCADATTQHGKFLTRIKLQTNESIQRGDEIHARGTFQRPTPADTPGAFDTQQWLRIQNIWLAFQRETHFENGKPTYTPITLQHTDKHWLRRKIDNLRLASHASMMPDSEFGVTPAISLGVSKTLDTKARNAFASLGIAHVLAVSGLHFGLIAVALTWFVEHLLNLFPRLLRKHGRQRTASVISLALLWLYVLVVGAPISAQRALIMMYACLLGRLDGRKPNTIRNLALAGTLILVINPNALFQASFQLSFSAVLGIFCAQSLIQRPFDLWLMSHVKNQKGLAMLKPITTLLIMTIGSSITTAPFAIWHFGQLPVLGAVANLIAIPLVSFVLLPMSLLSAITTSLHPVGELVRELTNQIETTFVNTMIWLAEHIPLASVHVAPHPITLTLFSAFAILAMFNERPTLWRRYAMLIGSTLIALTLAICFIRPAIWFHTDDLRVSFISMGQADATLIEFPDGTTMLIDAGNPLGSQFDMAKGELVPYLQYLGVNHIDLLVLTHPDYDHYAAITSLLENITIHEFWFNGDTAQEDAYSALQTSLNKHDVLQRNICHTRAVIQHDEVSLERLWPPCEARESPGAAPISEFADQPSDAYTRNDKSIVFKLTYKDFSALFTGDAGYAVEDELIQKYGQSLDVTLLKAGHHGSKHSTSESWLSTTTPQFIVFSAGKNNRYHFPSDETLKRSRRAGAVILRTDTQGTVRVSTNGQALHVETAH